MNINPMHRYSYLLRAKRCGAKTRKGTPCKAPATRGKNRCRMHGGAVGSGAPVGNRNALKHGYYTLGAINDRKSVIRLIKGIKKQLRVFNPSVPRY